MGRLRWKLNSIGCIALTLGTGLFPSGMTLPAAAQGVDRFNLLDFAPAGSTVDRTGGGDTSRALAQVIAAANGMTAKGQPACVYIPAGIYRIRLSPPSFVRAGCVKGDGPTQSIIRLDRSFEGDLFAWSEAWANTTSGPTAVGLSILGDPGAKTIQNALVFYDRNDEVFIDNVEITGVHGHAIYSGATKHTSQAYMRESHLRSLRLFLDGAPGVPVVEFSSRGTGATDATNEIRLSQVDIYGANGPGFVIRNDGDGVIRNITVDELRIEGKENGSTAADLMTIGDPVMRGNVSNVALNAIELLDPYKGFAALRLTAPPGVSAPFQISVTGSIGGGAPRGQGLRIDAGRTSTFRLSGLHTIDTNVIIGRGVSQIVLDGGGQERDWTYKIDHTSLRGVSVPLRHDGDPSNP